MNPRLQLAMTLADEASVMIRRAFAARRHTLSEKSANDFATDTDREVEAMMAARITADFPGDVLLGEEGASVSSAMCQQTMCAGSSTRSMAPSTLCMVSPVATSIAVKLTARAGGGHRQSGHWRGVLRRQGYGAWLHRVDQPPVRLAVNCEHTLASGLIGSVLPSAASKRFERVLPAWLDVARRAGSIRRTGAAALDLAQVAAGRLDGFFVMSLSAWDAAAGALLVTEAGGVVCDFTGGNDFLTSNQVIAGSAVVAAELAAGAGSVRHQRRLNPMWKFSRQGVLSQVKQRDKVVA